MTVLCATYIHNNITPGAYNCELLVKMNEATILQENFV